jgi:cobalt-zinc-cadmium efflux system protein
LRHTDHAQNTLFREGIIACVSRDICTDCRSNAKSAKIPVMHEHAHPHDHGAHASERRLFWTLVLTIVYMVVQVAGGLLSGSLALLADSGHMLADAGALALAWVAARLAHRPSDALRSYGYHRFQILAAYTNGIALFAVAAWITVEALRRLQDPQPVLGGPMLAVALAGLCVNLIAFLVLRHGGSDLNVRGALLHVVGDILGSVAAIAAAAVILATGWTPIDPLLSILITLLILRVALDLVKRSAHILMEGTPEGFIEEELKADLLREIPGVAGVHHVHAWVLSGDRTVATLHLQVRSGADTAATVEAVKRRLHERHGIGHSTVQVEMGACPDHPPAQP